MQTAGLGGGQHKQIPNVDLFQLKCKNEQDRQTQKRLGYKKQINRENISI